jgi:hypothetical protein
MEMQNGFLSCLRKENSPRNRKTEKTGGGAQIMLTVANGFAMILLIVKNQKGLPKRLLLLPRRRMRRLKHV